MALNGTALFIEEAGADVSPCPGLVTLQFGQLDFADP